MTLETRGVVHHGIDLSGRGEGGVKHGIRPAGKLEVTLREPGLGALRAEFAAQDVRRAD